CAPWLASYRLPRGVSPGPAAGGGHFQQSLLTEPECFSILTMIIDNGAGRVAGIRLATARAGESPTGDGELRWERRHHHVREQMPAPSRGRPRKGPPGVGAHPADPRDLAPDPAAVDPDGWGLRLRRGVREPRPRGREGGSPGALDRLAGVVAGRLRPLWAALH